MTELIWDGKYKDGKKVGPIRIELPFQTVETVNETAQQRQLTLDRLFSGEETEWRNRLIWGDKKYVLPSPLAEFADQMNLIYIDPPFATGADFSFTANIPESAESFTKDRAAQMWCENAGRLTEERWRYVKVPRKEYQKLKPVEFCDLLTFVS